LIDGKPADTTGLVFAGKLRHAFEACTTENAERWGWIFVSMDLEHARQKLAEWRGQSRHARRARILLRLAKRVTFDTRRP
jgi:hypothetical protein